jgi:excisionase family DNA binding protein
MDNDNRPPPEELLKPGEVARLFRVDVKTVSRWGLAGKLTSVRTPGGQHRFRAAEVMALLNGSGQ